MEWTSGKATAIDPSGIYPVASRGNLAIPVRLEFACAMCDGVLYGVTLDRFMVRTAAVPPIHTALTLVAQSTPGTVLRLVGVVRWTVPGGFGAQFESLGLRELNDLSRWLEAVRNGLGAAVPTSATSQDEVQASHRPGTARG
jgi:hypothetical protein